MLKIVVTSLVLMRAPRLLGGLPSRKVSKEWELRSMVFSSLVLQIVLICLGNHRKYVRRPWIRVVTWSAYLLADSVAIYALGMIANMIEEIDASKSVSNMDPHAELSAFWAPFLLLHLGGPDTISAYAMEDSELWLRHLLTLVSQTAWTVYCLGLAESHRSLLVLAILILLSGFYKYGERIWVLRAASSEHFKDSLANFQPGRKFSNKIMEECDLKRAEGYSIVPHQVIEVPDDAKLMIDNAIADLSSQKLSSWKKPNERKGKGNVGALLAAHCLVSTSQLLFADHLFSLEERDICKSILRTCKWDFKVIEIELGLIYDVFYTKAKAIYTSWGLTCRLAIMFSIFVILVMFFYGDKRRYSKSDLYLTFLLLIGAILLEFYSLFHIIVSDRAAYWLIQNKQCAIFDLVNRVRPLSKRRRWSNSMGQYSLMSCSLKKYYSWWWKVLKILHVDEMVFRFLCQGCHDVTKDIRKLILEKIREKERNVYKLPSSWNDRGGHTLSIYNLDQLKWSIMLDFDMSILVWHTATELCYYRRNQSGSLWALDRVEQRKVKIDSPLSLHLSRYMLYLLFMYPSMLPVGIGSTRFRDIYRGTQKYFALLRSAPEVPASSRYERPRLYNPEIEESEIEEACAWLRDQLKTEFNVGMMMEDKLKFVLFNGCRLVTELEKMDSERKEWEVISHVWAEMLIYAANKCKAMDHAQQMRYGGELITHVWFLMAHHGLTDHFQIPHVPAIAEIRVNSW